MTWNKTHKKNTKERVLQSAAQLFTQEGYEKISINQVMEHAQLTRGAFYAHFDSKSDLYAQAIKTAANNAHQAISKTTSDDIASLANHYLSATHRDKLLPQSCPLACLITDITQQDQKVKSVYTDVFKAFITNIDKLTNDQQRSFQIATLMIGGIALSKALEDQKLSDSLLSACQSAISTLANINKPSTDI
ncbi:TetR/AcrR family transcriptional regulator [Pseudoalteromonas sp. S554]|jgi:TetR/AcrR family transcriptional repressor of nem operon|uniref:TetR/AcrR family transcriptional regulator n=1 Tax=Pseudoalteromonas sp. S554 TaxID=2066516 RepID=UPI00110CAC7E|nr:TetR/AcrR family transcriptional regulator [Pseudoalteromonas sp. S554]TMS82582.1 TetR/AcrR family transcriptional regulator [Pseudoalteromonas sp. S554]|tara:strand:+ start:1965 stop:2537 length:573 start_codon:yes stop_codon:yes gene_type:complete